MAIHVFKRSLAFLAKPVGAAHIVLHVDKTLVKIIVHTFDAGFMMPELTNVTLQGGVSGGCFGALAARKLDFGWSHVEVSCDLGK